MKEIGGFKRADFAEIESLKKDLTNAKASEEQIKESYLSLQEKYESKKKEATELGNKLHLVKCSEIDLLEKLEEIKLDVFSSEYKNQNNEPVKNIDVVKFLEKENKKTKESLKQTEDLKLELEEFNKRLESDLKALREQNKVLENKVTALQEKNNSRANMSDYEMIKTENESLKKENADLKLKIKSILERANESIKGLFKFKIFQDIKFGYDKLNEEDWAMECDNDARLENKFNAEITGALIAEEVGKIDLKVFEKLNQNLAKFANEKTKEEDYDYSNDWGMQR